MTQTSVISKVATVPEIVPLKVSAVRLRAISLFLQIGWGVHAHASVEQRRSEARETRARRKESLSLFVPLPSRAFW